MTGKRNETSLSDLFGKQILNQLDLLQKGKYDRQKAHDTVSVPVDDVGLASYHVQQLMSEIGEVLDADKRWKSHRNDECDMANKLEEIADCFIVLMNIAMFSGFTGDELTEAIDKKLETVRNRIMDLR